MNEIGHNFLTDEADEFLDVLQTGVDAHRDSIGTGDVHGTLYLFSSRVSLIVKVGDGDFKAVYRVYLKPHGTST